MKTFLSTSRRADYLPYVCDGCETYNVENKHYITENTILQICQVRYR